MLPGVALTNETTRPARYEGRHHRTLTNPPKFNMASSSVDMVEAASFHGYHPVQVVDDVINCFHDCARRRAATAPHV